MRRKRRRERNICGKFSCCSKAAQSSAARRKADPSKSWKVGVSLSLSYRYTGHRVTRCFALKSKVFRHCTSAQSSTARIRQSHGKSVSLSLSMYSGHRVTRCFALLKAKSSDTARFNIEFTLILQLAEESCNLQRKCWHFVKYAINQRGQ